VVQTLIIKPINATSRPSSESMMAGP